MFEPRPVPTGFLGLPISTPAAIGTLLAAPVVGLVLAIMMAVAP